MAVEEEKWATARKLDIKEFMETEGTRNKNWISNKKKLKN